MSLRPKCIGGPVCGAYSAPLDSPAVGDGLAAALPSTSPLLSAFGLEFRPFRRQQCTPRQIAGDAADERRLHDDSITVTPTVRKFDDYI